MRPQFFIDTANLEDIQRIWDWLATALTGKELVGITTNPNAMAKCNIHTLREFNTRVTELCELVSSIRKDASGVVYVQHPLSNVSQSELSQWVRHISTLTDGTTSVGIKITPYLTHLEMIDELQSLCDVNVTGVADCATALQCLAYPLRYVSIIPGRMEEKGIDANQHLLYLVQRRDGFAEVITGSMRTLEGLQSAISHYTVPTIGTKVFDLMMQTITPEAFLKMWKSTVSINNGYLCFSPDVTDVNRQLSVDFFKQMDDAGAKLYQDMLGQV